MKLLTTHQIIQAFGKPGDDRNLVTVRMPYERRIAWDLKVKTSRMQCHKLLAKPFVNVHADILNYYGFQRLQELEIDIFGGCYNFRKMRGGSDWSRHSWGIAEDLNPVKNGLKATSKTAQFAKPEYKPMLDCYYDHGFLSYGIEQNFDWMHMEFADLRKL